MISFEPESHVFTPDSIDRQTSVLERADTVLVDSTTRPMFGPLDTGRIVEIGDRKITIGGQYVLGTGSMGLGVVLASDANFARLFPQRGLNIVNLGAIQLKPGVDPDRAADDLRRVVGSDLQIFTRKALEAHETAYWTTRTSVGIVFGSGLLFLCRRNHDRLPIVSTRSPAIAAIRDNEGDQHPDRSLAGTVSAMSLLIVVAGFIPALGARWGSSRSSARKRCAGDDERDAPPRRLRRRARHGVDFGAAPLSAVCAARRPLTCLRGSGSVGYLRPSPTPSSGSPE